MAAFYGTSRADTFLATSECDQFYINNVGDVIIGGGAGDTVSSTIDYVLDAGITSLVLAGRAISATGNDTENFIAGNRYDNVLNGGKGIDRLTGGSGADTFVFDSSGRANADYINDFVSGVDCLAISGSAFGIASGASFDYIEDWTNLGSGPAFIREEIAGLAPTIWFDADGQGGQVAELLCTLQWRNNGTSASDFAIL